MPDDHVVRTATDKDPTVGPKVVRTIGHIFEGVVGEGEVDKRLISGLPSVSTSSVGLNPSAAKDTTRRGRTSDGGIGMQVGKNGGALVGPHERSAMLALNPYPGRLEVNRRGH